MTIHNIRQFHFVWQTMSTQRDSLTVKFLVLSSWYHDDQLEKTEGNHVQVTCSLAIRHAILYQSLIPYISRWQETFLNALSLC